MLGFFDLSDSKSLTCTGMYGLSGSLLGSFGTVQMPSTFPKRSYQSEVNMNGLTKRALATSLCFGTVAGMQAAISVSGVYSNNFDSLAGATLWLNDTTMPGGYANRSTI